VVGLIKALTVGQITRRKEKGSKKVLRIILMIMWTIIGLYLIYKKGN